MISNPALPFPGSAPRQVRPRTLNDFRVAGYVAEPRPANAAVNVSGFVLFSVLAMGAFVMLDPFGMFGPGEVTTSSPASPAVILQTKPAEPVMKQIIAPQATAPAARSDGEIAATAKVARAPIAHAPVAPPIVQADRAPAITVQRRAGASAPESRVKPTNRAAEPIVRSALEEQAALPAIVLKPEAQADAPVIVNRLDEVKEAPKPEVKEVPKPGAAHEQPAAVKEDSN
ncbi:MAG: hypothetical protein IPM02_19580 [Betaproteobacteria bacterium]|nr:hypothetical protein [Betaproteobacteria bacterium]